MVRIVLDEAVFSSPKRRQLAVKLGCSEAAALGALALFWRETRAACFISGRPDEILAHLPAEPRHRPALLRALVETGYVTHDATAGVFSVAGNAEYAALINKRRSAGRQGRAQQVANRKRRAQKATPALPMVAANPKPKMTRAKPKANRALSPAQLAARAAWDNYAAAYAQRWGVPPTRNARSNALIAQFVSRVGGVDAPHVLAFYVVHNDRDYMRALHPLTLAVRDAEALHVQWQRGDTVTRQDVVRAEVAGSLADQLRRIGAGEV